MSNFTKAAIEASFSKLLAERPLAQITVKDIVADCGVNRNTFYYYFEDIPKLIEEIVMADAETIIQAYPTVQSIEECINTVIDLALAKKQSILHIYQSANREIYEQYLWKVLDRVADAYVTTALNGRSIRAEDLDLLKKYVASVAFGIGSNWLRSGMKDDIRALFQRLYKIKADTLEEMIARLEAK